jgi:hypothetical protein
MEYSTYTTKVKGPGVDHTIWLRFWQKTENLEVPHEDFECSEFDEVLNPLWFTDESGGKYSSGKVLYSGHCRSIPTKQLQCVQSWGAPATFLAGVIKKIDRTKARSVMIKKLDVVMFDTLTIEQYWRFRDALLPSVAVCAFPSAAMSSRRF